jgi:hypothetical protein
MTMRHAIPALIAVLALIAGCAKPPSDAGGAASMVIKQKDGTSLTVPLPAPNGKPENVAGVSELTSTFLNFCLDAFPDDHAVSAKADQGGFHELSDEQVRTFLKGDPGRGWARRIKDNIVIVSVEAPPYHACAVRTFLPTEPDMTRMTALAVGLWASQLSSPERLVPRPRARVTAADGIVEDVDPFYLFDGTGHPVETAAIYTSHYSGKEEVEVRLVRTRGDTQH